tara:strand:- start:221 stop:1258 length:1038 start_codon:yes stop_codon:yes gene_type:complete
MNYLNIDNKTNKHVNLFHDLNFISNVKKNNKKYDKLREKNIVNVFCKFNFPYQTAMNVINEYPRINGTERDLVILNDPHLMKPKNVTCVNKKNNFNGEITLFVDKYLCKVDNIKSKYKIGVLLESKTIKPATYKFIKKNHKKFDLILTHDKEILDNIKNSFFISATPPGLLFKNYNLYPKTKLVSFVYNIYNKNTKLYGYTLRKKIFDHFNLNNNPIDMFVSNQKKFIKKETFLKDYMFTIICLNNDQPFYFTDALLDPLICGTIPIYYGLDPKYLDLFFYKEGFLHFKTLDELIYLLENKVNKTFYNNNYKFVKKNHEKIKEYYNQDDIMINIINKHIKNLDLQ